MQAPPRTLTGAQRLARAIDRIVLVIARHWLTALIVFLIVFAGLPLLAPVLVEGGFSDAAQPIYFFYGFTCHQFAHRSFFLFGTQLAYSLEELEHHLGMESLDPLFLRSFQGDPEVGYKVAYCSRDTAIYTSALLATIVYAIVRRFRVVKPLSLRMFLLIAILPLAIDGLTQLVGLRESTALIRTVTGTLVGVTAVWLILPPVEKAMQDLYGDTSAHLARLETHS